MAHFPLYVDLSRKKCMIFGGGKVALRKIETLLKYDADLEIISRSVVPEIEEMVAKERIHLSDLSSTESIFWLERADLVIAATNDRAVNHFITSWCSQHDIPVNVIDAPEECTFLFPSVVKKGEISIGINTGAKSPIVSKQIRQEIEKAIPDYYGEIADQLGQVRNYLKMNVAEEKNRRQILKEVAANAFASGRILSEEELLNIYKKVK